MKATIGDTVIAEAAQDELVKIEGNWYFPPASLSAGVLVESPTAYTCPWKGVAQYWSAEVDGSTVTDAAWSYPEPYPASLDRVGTDYSGYVAFDKSQVTIAE